MRARSIWFVVTVVATSAGFVACNAVTGAGDLRTRPEDGEPVEAGSTAPDDASSGEMDASAPASPCECVAEPAAGWIGPVALLGEDAPEPAPCPAGLAAAMIGGTFPDVPEPGCEPCTCMLTGACRTVTVQTFGTSGCTSTSCGVLGAATVGTTCTPLTYCQVSSSVGVTSMSKGSCTPAGGARRPAGWKRAVTACAFTGGTDGGAAAPADAGCDRGLTCAPKITDVPGPTCIVHEGEAVCPDGPYSVRFTFGGSLEDTRTCSPCACGAAQATCSGGALTVYTDGSCTSSATQIVYPATCGNFSVSAAPGGAKITTTPSVVDGGCPPSGGVVTGGAVTSQSPWTACCLP